MRVAAITMNEPAVSRSWNCTASRCERYWSVTVRMGRRARSSSLVRQRCRSRSSGPTKDSTRTVSPGAATSPATPPPAPVTMVASRGEPHRGADLLHRARGRLARAARPLVQHVDEIGGALREGLPALADGGERRQHVLEEHRLAVQTADGGGAAAGGAARARAVRREDAVQVEHRAHVRVAGIAAPLA